MEGGEVNYIDRLLAYYIDSIAHTHVYDFVIISSYTNACNL